VCAFCCSEKSAVGVCLLSALIHYNNTSIARRANTAISSVVPDEQFYKGTFLRRDVQTSYNGGVM
jgi:hypothetical protein